MRIYKIRICPTCGAQTSKQWALQRGSPVELYICSGKPKNHATKTAETITVVPKAEADHVIAGLESEIKYLVDSES